MLELGVQISLLLVVSGLCVAQITKRPRTATAASVTPVQTPLQERPAVLPLSTIGQPLLAVLVWDDSSSTFRRVGAVDASGKTAAPDVAGDGIRLARGGLYRLVTRPQNAAFRPAQIRVSTAQSGADAWLIHNVLVGSRSQFVQMGAVPAGALRDVVDAFDTVQAGMDFCVDVSYQGPAADAPFVSAVLGFVVG